MMIFWTIWKHDYLLKPRDRDQLFERRKRSTNRDPQAADIVFLDEETQLSRGLWPMVVILRLTTIRDDKIRCVILCSTGRETRERSVALSIRDSVFRR